ncbi:methyltransferase family protein [Nocardioides jejuensis]|uniref:Isoprenylcysteine carboxylmethyltransferase family protein n=1 Tax=Nocardioides jejuensis TaxID=2502782 RepID=A0A4R1C261_9ACTN|nr:isoprenylcysteine carboxylmethyltransferase family protein [Nocardioides jejuensis]TCJ24108.1 isoprenylcysteine carboxylmethyltransferase family protein [Nocardioides jejuensis]
MPVVPPPVIALGFAGVQRLLAPKEGAGPVRKVAASALAAGSVGLVAAAAERFRAAQTTVHPLHPEKATALVTDGPYRRTRNPMYVGMAGALAAHALGRGGAATWLPVAAFVVAIDELQVLPEERAMERNFGDEWDDYALRTKRWL